MSRDSLGYALLLSVLLLLAPRSEHRNTLPETAFFCALPEQAATLGTLSPYDGLLRQYADSLGWDWRLLAAVVYHESRFNNEAVSSKGATGLMQILSTKYSEEELLNPARNLEIGSRYLKRLQGMYPAASPLESVKFALAAFNLGEGRVNRLIEQAGEAGLDTTQWDQVAQMLPKGHHTVAYVEKVLNSHARYKQQYPR